MATGKHTTATAAPTITKRVVGNQLPGYLHGRPRSFWVEIMAPKRPNTFEFNGIDLSDFDVAEIIDDLKYSGSNDWAA